MTNFEKNLLLASIAIASAGVFLDAIDLILKVF